MREFEILESKVEALGRHASDSQQSNLADWIFQNIDRDYWQQVGIMLCMDGLGHAYSLISERCGEFGMY